MKKLGLLIALIAWPGLVGAIELDFYTYNAFEETTDGFKRLALIFSDDRYWVFVGIFIVFGILVGGIATAVKGISGQQVNPLGFVIPVLIGVAIVSGLVAPTGRIHIYDPVRNAYEPVDGVPDIIILMAGALNKVERGIVLIIETGSADPFADTIGGIDYSLILSAMNTTTVSINLEKTMSRYYRDCGIIAVNNQWDGVTRQELLRSTENQMDTWAKFDGTSVSTVVYTDAANGGITKSCKDAWDDHISPGLLSITAGDASYKAMCNRAGFNYDDLPQRTRCHELVEFAASHYGITTPNADNYVRSVMLARAMSDALNSADFSMQQRKLVDRQVMAEGFGSAQAMNQWVPKLRGFLTATVLGLMPLLVLFVATPLLSNALKLMFGLFLWLAMWGACDAVAVQMAIDIARDAFSQIREHKLGFEAIMHSPEAAVQALGIFGKARMMAIMLATVLSGALFKVATSYAFTSMAHQWQSHLDQAGEAAGRQTMLTEEKAALQRSLVEGEATATTMARYGQQSMAGSSASTQMRGAAKAEGYIQDDVAGSRHSIGSMAGDLANRDRGGEIGSIEGLNQASNRLGEGHSVFELSKEQSSYQVSKGAVKDITKHDYESQHYAGGHLEAAEVEAGTEFSSAAISAETYRRINGTDEYTPGGWFNVAHQLHAKELAFADIASPAAWEKTFGTEGRMLFETMRTLESQKMGAEGIAHMEAVGRAIQAEGMDSAIDKFGRDAVQSAENWKAYLNAGTGEAAMRSEDPVQGARELSDSRFQRETAESNLHHALSERLGASLLETAEWQSAARASIAVTPENYSQVVQALPEDVRPQTIRALASGGRLDFSMDPSTGGAVSTNVFVGNQGQAVDTFDYQSGTSSRVFDIDEDINRTHIENSRTANYTDNLQGGLSLIYDESRGDEFANEIARVYEGQPLGERNEQAIANIGGVFNAGLREAGFQSNSQFVENWNKQIGGSAGIGGKVSLLDKAVAKLGVQGKLSAGATESYTDQSTIQGDIPNILAQRSVEISRIEQIEEYNQQQGNERAFQSLNESDRNQLEREFAEKTAERLQTEFEYLRRAGNTVIEDEINDNDLVEEARSSQNKDNNYELMRETAESYKNGGRY